METLAGFSTVAILIALVELVKKVGLPTQFAPLASLALGIGLSFLAAGVSVDNLVVGLVLGLSASGLWSGTKSVLGK